MVITKCEFTYMKLAKSIRNRWLIAHACRPCSKKMWRLFSVATIVRAFSNGIASLLSATPRTVSYSRSAATKMPSCAIASAPPLGSQEIECFLPVRREYRRTLR